MNPLKEIQDRWSPRAFSSQLVSDEVLQAILVSALSAPSANNNQPWRFILAKSDESLKRMRSILNPTNQVWANQSPILLLLCAQTVFEKSGKKNHYASFDSGCAWGLLAIEARHQGLYTHAMGGFDRLMAKEIYELDEFMEPQIVIALGYLGDPAQLPDDLRESEKPKSRKAFSELKLSQSDEIDDLT